MRDISGFVRAHLSPLGLPPDRELKVVQELAAQLEEAYDGLIADGRSEADAWNELVHHLPEWTAVRDALLDAEPAVVRMSHPERRPLPGIAKRRVIDGVRAAFSTGLGRDLRTSVRQLVKARGFTTTTIATLALCLGANVAIFTIVYGVLLRPLPLREADRLVVLGDVYPTITPDDIFSSTVPAYIERQRAITALEDQALFTLWFDTVTLDGVPQELRGMRATPSLFSVLGVQPALGRPFAAADAKPGADLKIILSHGLWLRLFGGDPAVLGRDVRLGWTGQRYTVVGVMPRDFSFFDRGGDGHVRTSGDPVQFWLPLTFTAAQTSEAARTRYGYFHIGRLRNNASVEQVRAQVDALNADVFARFPELGLAELRMYTAVTPLQQALTRNVRGTLYLLWGGAVFVLLIGALNIANLSLARATTRRRELVTRLALGAGRARLVRLLVIDGVVLATAGALGAIGIAAALLRLLVSSGLANLPNAGAVSMGPAVIAATFAAALLVGALIGVATSVTVARLDLSQVLATGSRSNTGGRSSRLFRRALIVTQVAASLVLLIGAALLLTTFRNLLSVDAGVDPDRVVSATVFPPPSRYPDGRAVAALTDRILDALRALPGVEAAGITSNIAMSGSATPSSVSAVGRPQAPGDAPFLPSVVIVSPGYFEAMSMRLVRGRLFAPSDRADAQQVAIVDERLASKLWPGEDPLGQSLQRGDSAPYVIVGIMRNVRLERLDDRADVAGTAYFPHTQAPPTGRLRWLAVRTAGDPAAVVPALRSTLAALDPDLPLSDIQTMGDRIARSVAPQKLAMTLATLFGAVALALAIVGIYGVLAFLVARRRREIGIRLALGSSTRGIFGLVFGEGLLLVSGGLALGLCGAAALGRVLQDQLYGVSPTDPVVLGAVAVATGGIALVACVAPARRASRLDPLTVLGSEAGS